MPAASKSATPAARPAAPRKTATGGRAVTPVRNGASAPARPPSAYPPAPYPQMAYDPGYAALGGPAPILVQAKPSWSRPGTATGASVLSFILAGFCLLGAIMWFSWNVGASLLNSSSAQASFMAWADTALAIGFLVGAVGLLARQEWGRFLLAGAAGLDVAYDLYRMADPLVKAGGPNFSLIILMAMDVLVVALCFMPPTTTFVRTRDPVQDALRQQMGR